MVLFGAVLHPTRHRTFPFNAVATLPTEWFAAAIRPRSTMDHGNRNVLRNATANFLLDNKTLLCMSVVIYPLRRDAKRLVDAAEPSQCPASTTFPCERQSLIPRHLNIRTSNSNGFGLRKSILEKSACAGFSSTFHSPRIAAVGTSKATRCSLRIHSSPNLRKDSSRVSCQFRGNVLASSLPISTPSGLFDHHG